MAEAYNTFDLRLKWAEQHILHLEDEVSIFLDSGPCEVIIEVEKDSTGQIVVHIKTEQRRQVPPEISFRVADVIHHLRAVLDNTVWSIGQRVGASERISFPVAEAESGFPLSRSYTGGNSQARKDLEKLPDELRAIIEDVQPYKAGEKNASLLWVLNHLWNGDKHRAPVLTTMATHIRFKPWLMIGDHQAYFSSIGQNVNVGRPEGKTIVSSFTLPRGIAPDTKLNLEPTLQVVLDEPGPAGFSPIVSFLTTLHRVVGENILEKLKPFL